LTREHFKDLFENHFDAVRNYIYYRSGDMDLSTDIAQDTFMRIWEKQLGTDHPNIKGLLFKIAGDMFISSHRKQKNMSRFSLQFKAEDTGRSPEDLMLFEELKNKYEKALLNLPEKQRTVFLMSRLERLKYHEIAGSLGLSVKAVEKRMNLALAYLKQVMES
jgi:RNA polymerase sigma factor (sigma-70 family)